MNRKQFFGMLGGMKAGDLKQIQNAYWLAKNAHRLQVRDDGTRYFEHPRSVATLLLHQGRVDTDIITKALLHDVVEDTNTPFEVIVDMFGHDIWASLFTLSKVIPVFDPVTGQIFGRFKKPIDEYYAALCSASKEDRLVKCADRLHNLQTMDAWDEAQKQEYVTETRNHLIPLASGVDVWFTSKLMEACAYVEN